LKDDEGLCEASTGYEIVCLRLSTCAPFIHDLGLVLVAVLPGEEYAKGLPADVRGRDHVYRRIGLIEAYKTTEWRHETESEEWEIYLV
jgi:hypothetical protein